MRSVEGHLVVSPLGALRPADELVELVGALATRVEFVIDGDAAYARCCSADMVAELQLGAVRV